MGTRFSKKDRDDLILIFNISISEQTLTVGTG